MPRDLLHHLPIPAKLQSYLNTPFYYSETIADEAQEQNHSAARAAAMLESELLVAEQELQQGRSRPVATAQNSNTTHHEEPSEIPSDDNDDNS